MDVTQTTLGYLENSAARLSGSDAELATLLAWEGEVNRFLPLIAPVIDQTRRRVFDGESVPAADQIVSLFEPRTDIIIKDQRDVHYGHKLKLTHGASGLIFDIVIEAGNSAGSERCIPMLQRHIERCGSVPRQVAADDGYASKDNLAAAIGAGAKDMAFHKKRGLSVEAMMRNRRAYRKLRNFRTGIEAGFRA